MFWRILYMSGIWSIVVPLQHATEITLRRGSVLVNNAALNEESTPITIYMTYRGDSPGVPSESVPIVTLRSDNGHDNIKIYILLHKGYSYSFTSLGGQSSVSLSGIYVNEHSHCFDSLPQSDKEVKNPLEPNDNEKATQSFAAVPTASRPKALLRAHSTLKLSADRRTKVSWDQKSPGEGCISIQNGDIVVAQIEGKVPSINRIFYSKPEVTFRVVEEKVPIPGLLCALEGMKVKEERRVTIPPEFGYKQEHFGSVPANSTLVVNVLIRQINPERREEGASSREGL
ncbi:hypothetical protein EV714DRAFT_277975 [Schizophyllum commune]